MISWPVQGQIYILRDKISLAWLTKFIYKITVVWILFVFGITYSERHAQSNRMYVQQVNAVNLRTTSGVCGFEFESKFLRLHHSICANSVNLNNSCSWSAECINQLINLFINLNFRFERLPFRTSFGKSTLISEGFSFFTWIIHNHS